MAEASEKEEKNKWRKERKKLRKKRKKKRIARKNFLLNNLTGVGEKTVASLKEKFWKNDMHDIAKASVEDLVKVKGIGEKKAEKLIEEDKKLKNSTSYDNCKKRKTHNKKDNKKTLQQPL